MPTHPLYLVNSFTSRIFHGNPAAVVPLEEWLPADLMQRIAAESAVPETAFFVELAPGTWALRWFTPEIEMDLCGHATLATAHVLARHLGVNPKTGSFRFQTRSGELKAWVEGDRYVLDLPIRPGVPASLPEEIAAAFPVPQTILRARDFVLVYATEGDIRSLRPDRAILDRVNLDPGGVCCTAPGEPGSGVDFVSRFFTPQATIFEDPVTGSAHSTLVPYWAARLGKNAFEARQLSARGGELHCTLAGDRVQLRGQAVTWLTGTISSPPSARTA